MFINSSIQCVLIDNLLEKRTFISNEKTVIEIGSEVIEWSPKFRLYLITKEENAASNLELASKVNHIEIHHLFVLSIITFTTF